jgi:hypothetical protein
MLGICFVFRLFYVAPDPESVPVLDQSLSDKRCLYKYRQIETFQIDAILLATNLAESSTNTASKLLVTTRLTRSLEPILFPKLRIYFAEFLYPHSSMH